jgi:hypothetical protein
MAVVGVALGIAISSREAVGQEERPDPEVQAAEAAVRRVR